MKDECQSQEGNFQDLQQEFKELMAVCSPEEAAILSERFDKLMGGYTAVEDLITNRSQLCDKWSDFSDNQKDLQAKIKTLQVGDGV